MFLNSQKKIYNSIFVKYVTLDMILANTLIVRCVKMVSLLGLQFLKY
jgi:hypothetical protein